MAIHHFLYPFIHLWTFRFFPISSLFVNNTAMNIVAQISLWDPVFNSLNKSPDTRFLRDIHAIFHSDSTILHSHQQCTNIPILHIFTNIFFYNGHTNKCKVTSHCSFDGISLTLNILLSTHRWFLCIPWRNIYLLTPSPIF